jgi:hypothetical protein
VAAVASSARVPTGRGVLAWFNLNVHKRPDQGSGMAQMLFRAN